MQFIDLQKQRQRIQPEIDAAIQRVLTHGQFIMGPEVKALEAALADYVGVSHCVLNSSGTTALQIALMALNVGSGDEVVTTPFSFFATAEVIMLLGAKPVYVDIDPRTYNIDPALLEAAITDKTKAIIPVSLYGQCADFDAINAVAAKHGIPVIEDAAQSLGATYKGRKSCGLSTIATASFFPSKPLGCYGDGGACFTDDDVLAEEIRSIVNHGQTVRYTHTRVGINGRCDSIQAAILLEKLKIFDDELQKRQQVAAWYAEAFGSEVKTPFIEAHNISAYAQYTIEVNDRAKVQAALKAQDIPTAVHYPRGLHEQPAAIELYGHEGPYPVTEAAGQRVMSLPFHPYMEKADVQKVADAVLSTVAVAA